MVFENSTELIVELQFGEGGQDSKLFVEDLAEAYRKYGQSKGFQHETLTSENGHVILQFRGAGVYQAFQHETGGHCVQRVPPTESRGRRQTSMISVAVLPLPPVDPNDTIPLADLEIKAQTGKQGAGGQNVNKVASAIRCVYKKDPTIRVFINGRDQDKNKAEAIKIVNARWREKRRQAAQSAYATARKQALGKGGRGAKVRTYNFIESRVADHRLGVKTRQIDAVMRGKFDVLFQSMEKGA
jgi:peptide chain release factor 1